jgi:NAD(P)-dependent dehydrogenase (short-subunit alcohol dehydrogenase family)
MVEPIFAGKSAIVTGGSSGIGRASALALAERGCAITLTDISVDQGQVVIDEIRSMGGVAQFVECDIASREANEAAVAKACELTGRLDIAVNSAGYAGRDLGIPLHETQDELADRIIDVNFRGTFYSMRCELRPMIEQQSGVIVNISSGSGLIGLVGASVYTGSKHAVNGLTKAAALDYAQQGIRINAICPGSVTTGINAHRSAESKEAARRAHPIGRVALPYEIADAVVWLCSDQSSFVTGVALPVDGGYTAQ